MKTSKAIQSRQYSQLMLNLNQWVSSVDDGKHQQNKFSRLAKKRMGAYHNKLMKNDLLISQNDLKEWHQIRISAKRIRYISSFLYEIYPTKELKQYIKNLCAVQQLLGLINDATVAMKLINTMIKKTPNDFIKWPNNL